LGNKKEHHFIEQELEDEDKEIIREVFSKEIVPKLKKHQARRGNLCCEFAGHQYKNWTIRFTSVGSGFDIAEFEYDEEACEIDLDL